MIDEAKNSFQKYRDGEFRQFQQSSIETIQEFMQSDRKFMFLEAAPGFGKTCVAMVSGLMAGGLTYSVHTRSLQTQVTEDHPESLSLFGRDNYRCRSNSECSCADCGHTKNNPCMYKKSGCPYGDQKKKVLESKLKITNYSYIIHECNYAGQFINSSPLFIIDEGDMLESVLSDFCSLQFTPYSLRRLGLTEPSRKTSTSKQGIEPWIEFGQIAKERASRIISNLTNEIDSYGYKEGISEQQSSRIKERSKVIKLLERIDIFLDKVDKSWVFENNDGRLSFKPTWINEDLASSFLWQYGQKFVLMSAKFLPLDLQAKVLGIPSDELYEPIQIPSTFPPENRPIHMHPLRFKKDDEIIEMPMANMTVVTYDQELPKLCDETKYLLENMYPDCKVLIHTGSYRLAKNMADRIGLSRMIIHNTQDRQSVLDMFKQSTKPLVLLSPSSERGLNLPDDECRAIFLAKCLFVSLGDRVVSRRVNASPNGNYWYKSVAAQSIIQACGRGQRHHNDQCDVWILDYQIVKLIEGNPQLFPDYWKDAIVFG